MLAEGMTSAPARRFLLPDLGEGLTEAEVVSWLVAPGDTVTVDQPVVELESAKSVVELPCPFAGVVTELHAAVGASVRAGEPLLSVAEPGAGSARQTDAAEAEPASADSADVVPGTAVRELPTAESSAEPSTEPSGEASATRSDTPSGAVLIGYGTTTRKRVPARAATGRFGRRGTTDAALATGSASTDVQSGADSRTSTGDRPSAVVSPLVRRLAREHGFNAADLEGSGPNALVLRADVERRIAQETRVGEASGDQRIPITGLRKAVSERLSISRREIPEATIWLDVDATALLEAKDALQRSTGERFSVNALIARFVVAGLTRYPILNSSVDVEAGEIVQHERINLGLAAQTSRGLMVPVLHDAGSMTTRELRDSIDDLVSRAESGRFDPQQLVGGTFTLNNYGVFGVDGSAAIINYPEAAILGIGRIMDRPWAVDGQVVVRKVVMLSLVFDHRVCDGDVPSEFITFVARCIENPISVLTEL